MNLELEEWSKTLSFTFSCLAINLGLALIDLDHVWILGRINLLRLENMDSHDPNPFADHLKVKSNQLKFYDALVMHISNMCAQTSTLH